SSEATAWPTIATLYDRLSEMQPTAVIELNRAVAYGYAYGPRTGLDMLAATRAGGDLDGYLPATAAEAELTARAGDPGRAAELFLDAADLARSEPERRALLRRAREVLETP
ncbi:MAG TPA: RNA polymerase subunit sigma-24, partial [Actinoplanes sp.]